MKYELLYIIPQRFKDEEIPSITQKVDQIIKEAGGQIIREENLEKRRLAYLIKQTRRGFYILIEFELSPSNLQELQGNLRLTDEILRFQIIKKEIKAGKKIIKEKFFDQPDQEINTEELNKVLEEISEI